MITSRRRFLGAVGAAGIGGVAGCTSLGRQPTVAELEEWPPSRSGDELSFWSWQDNWSNQAIAFQHVADLETIERAAIPSNEQYERLADGETPDAVQMTPREFDRAVRDDLLQPLPVDVLPSWPPEREFRTDGLEFYERDGEYYGIPHVPLTHAVAYERTAVGETHDVESAGWGLLWDESFADEISMPADPVLAGQIAAMYTGQDPNDPDDVDAVRDALEVQRPLVRGYWHSFMEPFEAFRWADLLVAALPYSTMTLCSQDGISAEFVAPAEGVVYGQNSFGIPTDAENPYAGLEFIDWATQLRTGVETTWKADEWTLFPARAVDDDLRDAYETAADAAGIEPSSLG